MENNHEESAVLGWRGRGVVELTLEDYEFDDLAGEIARTLRDCQELVG